MPHQYKLNITLDYQYTFVLTIVNMKTHSNTKNFFDALGGPLFIAYSLNVHQVTVGRWMKADAIPAKYKIPILKIAKEKKVSATKVIFTER